LPYATQADLEPERIPTAELIQLTDDTGSGLVDAGIVTAKLTEASAMVDSYARQRYTVPLQTSEQVKSLTLDIATYKLFERRRRIPESVGTAYSNAIAFLRDVAAGRAALDQPVGATPQLSGGPVVVTEKPEKFSDENLSGFVPED